jgi:hypothetical protein
MGTELTVVKPQEMGYSPPALVPQNVTEGMTLAKVLSESSLVPQHLRGKVADCFLIVEQSMRWGLSPFAVAQATSVISGKLMFEGKLVAAVVNAKADLAERLRFDYSGEGETRKVTVSGTFRGEKEARSVDVTLKEARTNNEMWRRQPDQQLAYHGSRVWARRHAPEVMLGIYSPEEMGPQTREAPPVELAAQPTDGKGIMGLADATPDVEPIEREEFTEKVPIFNPTTGEEVGRSPGITAAQNAHIHAMLKKLGHHMDEFKRGSGKQGEILHLGKYRKKLKEKYSKEHTNELSIIEAGWVIEWLLKCCEKMERAMDRGTEPPPAPEPAAPAMLKDAVREQLGALMSLTAQLGANGHKGVDAQVAWCAQTLGRPLKAGTDMTTAEIARCLAVAEGQV